MANTIAVTPDSTIRLLKCPIKLDDHNQFTFNTVSAQTTYFQSLPYLESNNLTYIRKDGVIRVDTSGNLDYEDLLDYNYVMYKNTHYDSKWFYAYITDIEYKNDGCTEISIETDVFQTWYFEVTWQTSFIEREHCAVSEDLIHALLNSVYGMFAIEAIGFGRGLGVLDASSTKLKNMFMINPEVISEEDGQ